MAIKQICPDCVDRPGWVYISIGPDSHWEKCENKMHKRNKMITTVNDSIHDNLKIAPYLENGNAVISLFYFIDKYQEQTNTLLEQNDMWFKCSFQGTKESLGLKQHKMREAIKNLVGRGLIEYKNKGKPKTAWIKINFEKIQELLS